MDGKNTSAIHQMERLKKMAAASEESPLVMLNINRYRLEVNFPGGENYAAYMEAINHSVGEVGGSVLWRAPVQGSVVGNLEGFHEVLAVWYPSHKAFLELPDADGAKEMFRYRRTCVEEAHILELPELT